MMTDHNQPIVNTEIDCATVSEYGSVIDDPAYYVGHLASLGCDATSSYAELAVDSANTTTSNETLETGSWPDEYSLGKPRRLIRRARIIND